MDCSDHLAVHKHIIRGMLGIHVKNKRDFSIILLRKVHFKSLFPINCLHFKMFFAHVTTINFKEIYFSVVDKWELYNKKYMSEINDI